MWYPLKFNPIYKHLLWGGKKLNQILNKNIEGENVGESWEISTVKGNISVVSNGELSGKNLQELIELYPEEILGSRSLTKFGVEFPLLFKFIDAKLDLSIQVHPNDKIAKEKHNSFGKTEMWYVVQADENSKLIVGFRKNETAENYQKYLVENNIEQLLHIYTVQAGDVFFIESGTVHAIGAGTLIAEIQQTSDVTYRLYDWNRKDLSGKPRELHTDLALEAINFNKIEPFVSGGGVIENKKLVACDYFVTNQLHVDGTIDWKREVASFTVFMCIDGKFEMEGFGFKIGVNKGETVLVPAIIENMKLIGEAVVLEVTV